MPSHRLNQDLLEFIDASPTPWHAVDQVVSRLRAAGFEALQAGQSPSQAKVFYAQGGSVVAAVLGASPEAGLSIVGAHTDSPNLRFKPSALYLSEGALMASVETYGGVLLAPWFDRDLGLAGRAVVRDGAGQRVTRLFDSQRGVAVVPSLAIHLDREANKNRSINPETDINLVLGQAREVPELAELLRDWGLAADDELLAADVCAYPIQPSDTLGLDDSYLVAPRFDNLLSCFLGLEALLAAEAGESTRVLVLNDHEEVGSQSATGADSPFLESLLQDWLGDVSWAQVREHSVLLSVDNAHGVHPNFASKHGRNQTPQLNGGPVVKLNANQRYATEPETHALLIELAEAAGVPLQTFANRADLGCGSTIGPITASRLGVKTVDLGLATWAMHSSRETCGSQDPAYLRDLLIGFFERPVR